MYDAGSPEIEPVPTLFITGAPGAGKSALAHEISELLWQVQEPHAVIAIDELCRGVLPAGTPDFNRLLGARNLEAVWANFAAAGVRRLVLDRILLSAEDLDMVQQAVPAAAIVVCRLDVDPALLADRISHREAGSARPFLTRVSAELAPTIAALDLQAVTLTNGPDRAITDLAHELLTLVGWPQPTK
jgi:hypothetical protein